MKIDSKYWRKNDACKKTTHDKLFIDVSKQSDELFQYQGNTSSDDQYKNQQLDTETVSQQGSYSMPPADIEQVFQTEIPPVIPTSTTMPQQYSFNNAFQTVLLPQNMVQPAISNSNTLQQRGEQKQTYHHTYCPVIMEDFNMCVTYIAQVNSSADSRFSMSRETLSSMIYKHELKTNTTEIAHLCICAAQDYGTKYKVDIEYMDAEYYRQYQTVFLDKKDCTQGRIVQILKENGICCFNISLSQKKISDYLYVRIQEKLQNEKHELPTHSGFQEIDDNYCFVTSEFCDKKELPKITEKTFLVSNQLYSETAELQFYQLAQQHSSVKQFLR